MRHIKLTIQYDGTNYSGWQIQKSGPTIQSLIEDAVLKVTGEHARVPGAARTDAGVHALQQVAMLGTESNLEVDIIAKALNANLPDDIRITGAEECLPGFHPRHSALNKTYSYIISGPGNNSVFLKRYSWVIPYSLNCTEMRKAATFLIGKYDFSSFMGSGCNSRHQVREIFEIRLTEHDSVDFMGFTFDSHIIRITVKANAFLRHMVRNIAGTLVDIGRGNIPAERMGDILRSKDRRSAGPTAPAKGLFLEDITY